MKKLISAMILLLCILAAASCGKRIPAGPLPGSGTATLTVTLTYTAISTSSKTNTPAVSLTHTPSATPTNTPQDTATDTPIVSATESPTVTATGTDIQTATATATSTPAFGTITGTLILPSPHSGITYQVLVDTDLNFSNGIINTVVGTCGPSVNVPYSVTAQAGTFFVYAVVKTVSALQYPPAAGDYLGAYGATYPAMPGAVNVSVIPGNTAAGIDIDMVLAPANVYGTLMMPANANGKGLLMAMDDDGNVGNGGISQLAISTISGMAGNAYAYSLLCPFAGTFYIFAMVDNDASGLPGAPTSGDYLSFIPSGPDVINPAINNGPYYLTLTAF